MSTIPYRLSAAGSGFGFITIAILIISVITVITAGFLFYRVEQNTLDNHTILLEATNRHFHLFHSRLGKTSHQQRCPDMLADDEADTRNMLRLMLPPRLVAPLATLWLCDGLPAPRPDGRRAGSA